MTRARSRGQLRTLETGVPRWRSRRLLRHPVVRVILAVFIVVLCGAGVSFGLVLAEVAAGRLPPPWSNDPETTTWGRW
jgi:hypothetical protein